MMPARTSGTKHRPITAPERATACASGESRLDALENRVLQGVRHGGVADRAAVRPFVLGDRPEQLFDVERKAVGPRVDRGDDVARRRQTGAEDERRHERRLLEGQGCESRLLGDALRQEPRPPLPQESARRELVGAIGADDQQRSIAGRPSELGEDLEAQVVRPLQVVEGEHVGTVKRADDQVDGLEDECPAPRLRRRPRSRRRDRGASVRGPPTAPGASSSAPCRAATPPARRCPAERGTRPPFGSPRRAPLSRRRP